MPSRSRKSVPFVPAGRVLEKLLKSHGLEVRQRAWDIERRWAEIVGEKIAAHAAVTDVRHRKLIVAVDSAAWVQQLTLLKETILSRIRERLGESPIRDVVFRVAAFPPSRPNTPEAPPRRRPLTDSERAAVRRNLEGIGDAELRKILERVMTLDAGSRPEEGVYVSNDD